MAAPIDGRTVIPANGEKPRIVVAISGASGSPYAVEALRLLRASGRYETHLIISPAAAKTLKEETDLVLGEVVAMADYRHSFRDIAAPLSSGSFKVKGMLVAPCSVRTLGAISISLGDNLIVRAADVCLKERRPLVLMVRETPLHLGHIELMAQVTRFGAIVMPPVPEFYTRPRSIADMVTQTVARALALLDVETDALKRWIGTAPPDV